jgi:hypothetical protein
MKIEFFYSPDGIGIEGNQEIVKVDGAYMAYKDFAGNPNNIRILTEFLLDRPKCCEILLQMSRDGIDNPLHRFTQFKRCNLDALDKTIDIDTDNNYFNPEYINKCGHKGANRHCPYAAETGERKPYCVIKNKYQIPVKDGNN